MKIDKIIDDPRLRNRTSVFADREDAGLKLASLLANELGDNAIILAIPAGGVPVASAIARQLGLPLGLAVASKMLLPGNTEAGFGAVAFDGSEWLNEGLVDYYGLSDVDIETGRRGATEKVTRRLDRFCDSEWPDVEGRELVLVDDGLASGATLFASIKALRNLKPARLVVAVPTGSARSVAGVSEECDLLVCANIRSGYPYAVAAAYRHWCDVEENALPGYLT